MDGMSAEPLFSVAVAIEPVGKQRPKAAVVAGHAHIYTPSKTLDYENAIRHAFSMKYPDAKPTVKAVAVEIEASFGLNKGDYGKAGMPNKSGREKLSGSLRHTKKPDFDNVAKAAVDALNGIAWVDDCQICDAHVLKRYAQSPSISIRVYEL